MGRMILPFPCLPVKNLLQKIMKLFAVISAISGYIDNAVTSVSKHTETSKKLTYLGIVKTMYVYDFILKSVDPSYYYLFHCLIFLGIDKIILS